jgi:5-amino-6-(5-phospho-D-ribitylamino)uracil phosphatase
MHRPERHAQDLYVTDLDGTLLDAGGRLPQAARDCLALLLAGGASLTFCTARGIPDSRQVLERLPFTLPAGYYNGALIACPDTGQVLDEKPIPPSTAALVLGVLRAAGARPQLIGRVGADQVVFAEPPDNPAERVFHESRAGWDPRLRVCAGYTGGVDAVYALVCLDDTTAVTGWVKVIADLPLPDIAASVFEASEHPGHSVLQVGAVGADKGTAVHRLASLAGFATDRLVVFGDGSNDLPMFAGAREAYAVADATDEARRRACEVIGPSGQAGVPRKLCALLGQPWPLP